MAITITKIERLHQYGAWDLFSVTYLDDSQAAECSFTLFYAAKDELDAYKQFLITQGDE